MYSSGFEIVYTLHKEDFDLPALNINYKGDEKL